MAAPVVTSVSPLGGALAGGTAVSIAGTGFDTVADVRFDGVSATDVVTVSPTEVTCTTPAHVAGLVDVEVENGDAAVGSLADAFAYEAAPTLTSVSPAVGSTDGCELTLVGTGFIPPPAAPPAVTIDGVDAVGVEVLSTTRVRAFADAASAGGPYDIVLTNRGDQDDTLAAAFTYEASTPPAPARSNGLGLGLGLAHF